MRFQEFDMKGARKSALNANRNHLSTGMHKKVSTCEPLVKQYITGSLYLIVDRQLSLFKLGAVMYQALFFPLFLLHLIIYPGLNAQA